jgi:large subunit ribosomal protein L30
MPEAAEKRRCLAAVRIRGVIRAQRKVRETLQMLRLTRNNYAVLIDNRPSYIGMLRQAQHFITWGEVSKETVVMLMRKIGRLAGDKKLADAYTQKIGYKSLEEIAEAIHNCSVEYGKLPGIQPVFRLHPPSKGFRGKTKKAYGSGGETGYRGEKINELIERMM